MMRTGEVLSGKTSPAIDSVLYPFFIQQVNLLYESVRRLRTPLSHMRLLAAHPELQRLLGEFADQLSKEESGIYALHSMGSHDSFMHADPIVEAVEAATARWSITGHDDRSKLDAELFSVAGKISNYLIASYEGIDETARALNLEEEMAMSRLHLQQEKNIRLLFQELSKKIPVPLT